MPWQRGAGLVLATPAATATAVLRWRYAVGPRRSRSFYAAVVVENRRERTRLLASL